MSTSITISSAANVQATAANIAAQEAARTACLSYVQNYEHNHATVVEMREYANCIDKLHPNPMGADTIFALKLSVILLFVCVISGVFIYLKMDDSGIAGGMVGFMAWVVAMLVFGGLWFIFMV